MTEWLLLWLKPESINASFASLPPFFSEFASGAFNAVIIVVAVALLGRRLYSMLQTDTTLNQANINLLRQLQEELKVQRDRADELQSRYNAMVVRLSLLDVQQREIADLKNLIESLNTRLDANTEVIIALRQENVKLHAHSEHIDLHNQLLTEMLRQYNQEASDLLGTLIPSIAMESVIEVAPDAPS